MVTNGDGKMNNDMKCPFCQQELDYLAEDIYGNMYCPNCRDKNGFAYKASESVWQELIRTRETLAVAVEKLKGIKNECYDTTDVSSYVNKALEQITALEQKDK